MEKSQFLVAMSTCVLIKLLKNMPLTSYEEDYIAGVEEGFDQLPEKEKEQMFYFIELCEAEVIKSNGRMN